MQIEKIISYFQERFPFLSEKDIENVVMSANLRSIPKDENFIKFGERRKEFGFVLQGVVRAYFIKNGNDLTWGVMMEGGIVGNFESILLNKPSSRYFAPIENSVVLLIDYDKLDKILISSEKLEKARKIILQETLAAAFCRSDNFVLYNPKERYLNLINEFPDILQRVPLKYIASMLGITPVSLSRIRKRLNQSIESV